MTKNPIVAMREGLGLTQIEFAQASKIPFSTVRLAEYGVVNGFRQKTLDALSKITGQSPEDIQSQYQEWRNEQDVG